MPSKFTKHLLDDYESERFTKMPPKEAIDQKFMVVLLVFQQ